jgi:hypothetical protein
VAVRSYSAFLSIFSFRTDKTLLPPSFGQFSHMIIIAAAAYYVFNMYGLCLVVFMPAFCGQTVNPWLFSAIPWWIYDLSCISMVSILSWIQWLQSVSNMKSFQASSSHFWLIATTIAISGQKQETVPLLNHLFTNYELMMNIYWFPIQIEIIIFACYNFHSKIKIKRCYNTATILDNK